MIKNEIIQVLMLTSHLLFTFMLKKYFGDKTRTWTFMKLPTQEIIEKWPYGFLCSLPLDNFCFDLLLF